MGEEKVMRRLPWRKIILSLLLLTIIIGLYGCQLGKNLDNTVREFSTIPDRIAQGFTNLMGSVSGIGSALADSIGNIVNGMTGR
jgi:hypothetical protein